jgi:antibiotic biosynthesis monooxygenase (ABM) superfamily enzyme
MGPAGGLARRPGRAGAGPAQWKAALVCAAGILPLPGLVSYLLSPRQAALPAWALPLISVVIVTSLMQYVVMPPLTHAARGLLYPPRAPQPTGGAA